MRALIMAGGSGSRLGRGEKPLTLVSGRPMISYIADAYSSVGCEPVIAVSHKTPMTANWCRAQGIAFVRTEGKGYIEDMVSAVQYLEENQALIISVSDIPCITPAIITTIFRTYEDCGMAALSTWVPAHRVKSCRGGMPYHEQISGIDACPAGVKYGIMVEAVLSHGFSAAPWVRFVSLTVFVVCPSFLAGTCTDDVG